ncbi:DUF448 domain-containing protein [Candidatus Mycobacterium wuenschmannii]|uniref:DUF448 domain-containing protein n=1 Tax=Candidatus Mycobacterium wuenschmannii TaxID=3027808 RepID=UPI0036F446A2
MAVSAGNGKYVVTVDPAGTLPGRGAWLHPVAECATEAIRRRAFARALRITGAPETSAVIEHLESQRGSRCDGHPANRTGSKEHEHTVKSR